MIDPARNPQYGSQRERGEDRDKEKALSREGRRKKALSPYQQPGGLFEAGLDGELSEQEGGGESDVPDSKQGEFKFKPRSIPSR